MLYMLQITLLFYVFTDNATFLEIFLNVTACDTEQYQCYVQAQASLEVSNRNYSLPFTYKILDSFAVVNLHRQISDACPSCRPIFISFHAVLGKNWPIVG